MSYFENIISTKITFQKAVDSEIHTTHEDVSIASGAVREYLIVTGTDPLMLFANMQNNDEASMDFYEGTTVSANGTAMTLFTINRNNLTAAPVSIYHTPTITADGTLLEKGRIFAASNIPMSLRPTQEIEFGWILATSSNYLLRFTNDTGAGEDLLTQITVLTL